MLDLNGLGEDIEPEVIDRELDIRLGDIGIEGQPRTEFDESLIQTIARQFNDPNIGQTDNIVVKVNPAGSPPYILIHGETRLKAAYVAGKPTLRSDIKTEGGFARQLISNETRGDLSMMDKARAYQELIDSHGYKDQKAVANLLGCDENNVSKYINLLSMNPTVQLALDEGKATTVSVLDDLRLLINKNPKRLDDIERFVNGSVQIRRSQIEALSKTLSKRKPKANPKKAVPMIDGKAFDVVNVSDGVMTIRPKGKGDKVEKQYRLVPVEQSENT